MTEPRWPLRPPGPPGRHPSPEELYRAATEPAAPECATALAHAAACGECSAELARLEAFLDPQPMAPAALDAAWSRFGRRGEPASRSGSPARFRAWGLAVAAALAATLGLTIWRAAERPPGASADDGGIEIAAPPVADDPTRGGAESASAAYEPSGPLAEAPRQFRFPNPEAATHRLILFDAAQTYRYTSADTAGGTIELPEAERARLRPGIEYLWSVVDPDGAASPAVSFRIGIAAP